MNPRSPTTCQNQPTYQRRSTAAVVIGVILFIVSLFCLWMGVSLTQPGFLDLSSVGHVFVAVSILVGGGGIWLVVFGSRPADSATPDRSLVCNAVPFDPVDAATTTGRVDD